MVLSESSSLSSPIVMRKGECAENRCNIRDSAVWSKRIKEGPVTMNDDDDDVFRTAADRHGGPPNPAERTRADGLRCRSAPCPGNVRRRGTGMTAELRDTTGQTAEDSAESASPSESPRPWHFADAPGRLPRRIESVIVGYYTSAEVHPPRKYRTYNRKED
jgi:hypothetical protein